jgi:hypothetical protein
MHLICSRSISLEQANQCCATTRIGTGAIHLASRQIRQSSLLIEPGRKVTLIGRFRRSLPPVTGSGALFRTLLVGLPPGRRLMNVRMCARADRNVFICTYSDFRTIGHVHLKGILRCLAIHLVGSSIHSSSR